MRLLNNPHHKHTLHMADVFANLHQLNTTIMVRKEITPQQQSISIDLPQEYVGKQVEVIAFTIEETQATDKTATHFASEKALAKDWLTPEEDTAWHSL